MHSIFVIWLISTVEKWEKHYICYCYLLNMLVTEGIITCTLYLQGRYDELQCWNFPWSSAKLCLFCLRITWCFASCTAKCASTVHVRRPTLMTANLHFCVSHHIYGEGQKCTPATTGSDAKLYQVTSQSVDTHHSLTPRQFRVSNQCVFGLWEIIGKVKNPPRHGNNKQTPYRKAPRLLKSMRQLGWFNNSTRLMRIIIHWLYNYIVYWCMLSQIWKSAT